MRPSTVNCCNIDFETKNLHIFNVDNDLHEAFDCPLCGFMRVIGYSQNPSNHEQWRLEQERKNLEKEKKEFEHFINTGNLKENI